jgi:hypothetical protein
MHHVPNSHCTDCHLTAWQIKQLCLKPVCQTRRSAKWQKTGWLATVKLNEWPMPWLQQQPVSICNGFSTLVLHSVTALSLFYKDVERHSHMLIKMQDIGV